MKNFKLSLRILFALFLSASLFTACSVDNETPENEPLNESLESYLESFYSDSYRTGKKVNIPLPGSESLYDRTADFDGYTVTEIFVGKEERARGYLVENPHSQRISHVDVDRKQYVYTITDYNTSRVDTYSDINEIKEYDLTDQFDIIKIISDPVIPDPVTGNPVVISQGWKYTYGACNSEGWRGVYRTYYLFGFIRLTDTEPVTDESGAPVTVGCNEEYQP